MLNEHKEQVLDSTGKTAEEQVSDAGKDTHSLTDDPTLSLTKLLSKNFVLDEVSGETLTGQDLVTKLNNEKLLRRKQSDFDKATAEFRQKDIEYQTKMSELTNQNALLQTNLRLARLETQVVDPDSYDPFAEPEVVKPTSQSRQNDIDPEKIEQTILSRVEERLLKERQENERITAINRFDKSRSEATKNLWKTTYGMTEAEATQAVQDQDVALANAREASNVAAYDMTEAFKLTNISLEYAERVSNAQTKAQIRKIQQQEKAKETQDLEVASKALASGLVDDEVISSTKNPRDAAKAMSESRKKSQQAVELEKRKRNV